MIRVIDGDTIVVDLSGEATTVRLLNIDTPETKHPDKPVECLGAEATEFTESLLSPGDEIELAYDVSRLDPYGRTLAGVYKEGSLVNADIAAAGLGVAVLFQPNERFYPEVLAAEQSAQNKAKGLFGADVSCTVPALAEAAISDLGAVEETVPATAEAVGSALGLVSAAILAGKAQSAVLQGLDSSGDAVSSAVWASRKATYLPLIAAGMDRAASVEKKLTTKQSDLAQAKKKTAAKKAPKLKTEAKAKAEAKAAAAAKVKANAAAERKTAAKAAAQKKAAERKATVRSRQLAPKKTYRAPVQKPKRKNSSKSGYTGRRCYAPGGRTWKPC